jgi:hypothetical protein
MFFIFSRFPFEIEEVGRWVFHIKMVMIPSSWWWGGLCVGFFALCMVGFVAVYFVPCHVLKIAWGRGQSLG